MLLHCCCTFPRIFEAKEAHVTERRIFLRVALWRTAVERKIEGTFAGMTVVTIVEIPIEYVVPFGAIKQWLQVSCHKKNEAVYVRDHLMLPSK